MVVRVQRNGLEVRKSFKNILKPKNRSSLHNAGSFQEFSRQVKCFNFMLFCTSLVLMGSYSLVARTLGIPSRPVTNYASAHDTQGSLTVDYFMDDDGKAIDSLNTDSVWSVIHISFVQIN